MIIKKRIVPLIVSITDKDLYFTGRRGQVLSILSGKEIRNKYNKRLLPELDDVLFLELLIGNSQKREENELAFIQTKHTDVSEASIKYFLFYN